MIKVLCGGRFNFLHEGHKYFLKKARSSGDYLIVVIANDTHNKKREEKESQEKRKKAVEKLGVADKVVIGHEEDFFKVVEKYKPDIVVLGYDQNLPFPENKLSGIKVIKVDKLEKDMDNKKSHNKEIVKKVKFRQACPRCGSDNFHIESNISFVTGKAGFYICRFCGFSAEMFPKISEEEREKLGKDLGVPTKIKSVSDPKNKYDLAAIVAAAAVFILAGILGFVLFFGVYFLFRKFIL